MTSREDAGKPVSSTAHGVSRPSQDHSSRYGITECIRFACMLGGPDGRTQFMVAPSGGVLRTWRAVDKPARC
jgi:hypothetical protein